MLFIPYLLIRLCSPDCSISWWKRTKLPNSFPGLCQKKEKRKVYQCPTLANQYYVGCRLLAHFFVIWRLILQFMLQSLRTINQNFTVTTFQSSKLHCDGWMAVLVTQSVTLVLTDITRIEWFAMKKVLFRGHWWSPEDESYNFGIPWFFLLCHQETKAFTYPVKHLNIY